MLLLAALVPFVVLATRVVAVSTTTVNNLTSINITKRIDTGTVNVAKRDKMRSRYFLEGGEEHEPFTPDVPLDDIGVEGYTAKIGVGVPPTYCESCQFGLA